MKRRFIPAALIAAAIFGVAAAAPKGDPVVMTINGKDITRSEFEYLYKKNNLQQETPQSIDEYVDMFVVYKLKVAEAEAAGIDKTDSFIKEFDGYCADISSPYLVDTLVTQRLVEEAWGRMQTMRNVSHIMYPLGADIEAREANRAHLDSVRGLIMAGMDFSEAAGRFSTDRTARTNGGSMGWMTAGRFPYPFEKTAYDTPVGQVSEVFEDAPYGYHIIKVNDEKAHPGTVHARHILKMTQGLTPEEKAVKKAQMDSIHALLVNGADFSALAMSESEDPGSAQKGGDLGSFGPGVMVASFEEQAYATPAGSFSKPFESPFGYHIVQVVSHDGLGTLADNRKAILQSMARDTRITMPRASRIAELQSKWGFSLNTDGLAAVRAAMKGHTGTEAYAAVDGSTVVGNLPAGATITAAEVIAEIGDNVRESDKDPYGSFERQAKAVLENATVRHGREEFARENPEFRSLVNEYRDGILLFEISNRNVWDRASKDTEALQAYFNAHRDSYTWDKPRFKGCVVLATSDSIASLAKGFLATSAVDRDSLVSALRDRFGRDIKIERVLTAKGDNKIVDEIAFEGEKAPAAGKWCAWFPYDYKIIDAPEEAADVKAAVSSDLQQQLEAEWVKSLRSKYKVKINKKVLKSLSASTK